MCLITSPREDREYVKETYVSPRPARPTSQVYAYRDGTYSREYTTPVSPTVVRSEYARSDYAPSIRSQRSHRSRRSTSSRRSSSYLTAVPVAPPVTTATTTRHVYPALTQTSDLVPVARTETMYVTEEVTPPRSVVYTTGRVSPAVVMEDHRRRTSQMYY